MPEQLIIYQQPIAPHLVTKKGNLKSMVDLFVHWPETAKRDLSHFTYRGDRFPNLVTFNQQLQGLVKYFIKDYYKWTMATIRDNRIPQNDPNHIIIKYNRIDDEIKITKNRLTEFPFLQQNICLPDWLK